MEGWIYIGIMVDKNGGYWVKVGESENQTPEMRMSQIKAQYGAKSCRLAWKCHVTNAQNGQDMLFEACKRGSGVQRGDSDFWKLTKGNVKSMVNALDAAIKSLRGTYYEINGETKPVGVYVLTFPTPPA